MAVQILDISVPAYPEGHVWYFNPLAWQFLFVAGAVLGERAAHGANLAALARLAYPVAAVVFGAALVIKISWTLHGVWEPVPGLFLKELWPVNKNNLPPIRLLTFFALVLLVATHVPPGARFLRSVAARPLVVCGQQSLEMLEFVKNELHLDPLVAAAIERGVRARHRRL